MTSVRELQGLIQALDSKNYNNLFGLCGDVQDHSDDDSRRRSMRTRKPPTRFSNAATAQSRKDVTDASVSKLEPNDIESSRSLPEAEHEHEHEHEFEHEQRHDHGQECQEVHLEEHDEEPPPKRRKSSKPRPARSNKRRGA